MTWHKRLVRVSGELETFCNEGIAARKSTLRGLTFPKEAPPRSSSSTCSCTRVLSLRTTDEDSREQFSSREAAHSDSAMASNNARPSINQPNNNLRPRRGLQPASAAPRRTATMSTTGQRGNALRRRRGGLPVPRSPSHLPPPLPARAVLWLRRSRPHSQTHNSRLTN